MKNWMTTLKIFSVAVLAALVLGMTVANADPDSQQKNKNLWRNLGIGSAVIAGHGLLSHNGTETILGAAGAAYSANRYEQDRHHQSQDRQRQRDYANAHRYAYNNGSHRHTYRTVRYYNYAGHQYRYNTATGVRTMVS